MRAALHGGRSVRATTHHPHFTRGETGPEEPRKWPKVTQLVEADLALESRPVSPHMCWLYL